MIWSGRATFTVYSTETTTAGISDVLKLEPTTTVARGTSNRAGRVAERNVWSFDGPDVVNTAEDQTGVGALRELLSAVRGFADRVASLPDDCETRIWWSAGSDSSQGGFILPADLLQDLAALGVDVWGTVFIDDPRDD